MYRLNAINQAARRSRLQLACYQRLFSSAVVPSPNICSSSHPVPRCQACQQLQTTRLFYTSHNLTVASHHNSKKKIVKVVKTKKNVRTTWPTVSIRSQMTINELSLLLDRDIDLVCECLSFIPNTRHIERHPSTLIDDVSVIKAMCGKMAYKWNLKSKKKTVIKVNKDVTRRPPPDPSICVKRPPVVTIMGHVDHGKTTLLDALRKSRIVDKEFGGITQHIGAFTVSLTSGETITFLDTPGHAAFSNMRARGAQVTDIVILVVAAEDGVMKQTMESFRYAQNADVPVIVAINKIDKHEANLESTKAMLLRNNIILEEHGGDIQGVPISALKRMNLDQLQEAIITQSEMLDLQADHTGLVEGSVIEAKTDPGKGHVATVLIQRGTLKKGMCLVAGTAWAKVRNLFDDRGHTVREVTPGGAVEVSGWKDLPSAGDNVLQVTSEGQAREVVDWRNEELTLEKQKEELNVIMEKQDIHQKEYVELRKQNLNMGVRYSTIYNRTVGREAIESYSGPQLSLVLKGDVDGTLEALLQIFSTYDNSRCHLNLLQYGVGDVTEQDIDMAASFNGVIYAFNVVMPAKVEKLATERGVIVHHHNVIYKLLSELIDQLQEQVQEETQCKVLGEATVQQRFLVTEKKKKVSVAGCRCNTGSLVKDKLFKLVRDGEVIVKDQGLASMKHFKQEVSTIMESQECGLLFADQSFQPEPGDEIICYDMETFMPTIDWQLDF